MFLQDPERYAATFRREGFAIFNDVATPAEVEGLGAAIAAIPDGAEVRRKRHVYGVRNLLEVCPAVQSAAGSHSLRDFVTPILGNGAFAVRATFFDKVPGSNWSLFWHQDNVISVEERRETPGFLSWSRKAAVWHVQPPAEVLAKMVAVRLHLDDCGPDNGPLRVLPGSHKSGWLDESIDDWKWRVAETACTVRAGGVITMCPLILHASGPAATAGHRRVIHIEYAAEELPFGLRWKNRVGMSV